MPFASFDELRAARNQALAASDYFMLEDAPETRWPLDQIKAYREDLRHLPQRAQEIGLENTELPSDHVLMLAKDWVPPAEEPAAAAEEEPQA